MASVVPPQDFPVPTPEVATNPIVAWFQALSDSEKAEYDRLAEAGQQFQGEPAPELEALALSNHPLQAK